MLHSSPDDATFISQLRVTSNDVLTPGREQRTRKVRLLQAVALGTTRSTEVMLTVEDQLCCRRIRTRVVAAGDDRIMLEKGLSIPLQCIRRVDILAS
jgi:hypothetical protein